MEPVLSADNVSTYPIGPPRLTDMCLQVACLGKENIESWRRQTRTLERLPSHLAHPLFHNLLRNGLLTPPLLELFRCSVEEINVSGEPYVDAQWTAYFRDFQCLRILEAANCRSLSNFAISLLRGIETLEVLNISACPKITDHGAMHLLYMRNLQKLGLSDTKITRKGLVTLSSLKQLKSLDLGGLPVDDSILLSLLELTELENLEIWGSNVSNHGVQHLKRFPNLQYLNLAWTSVTELPALQSLKHLNMAKCNVSSMYEEWEGLEGTLEELYLSGAHIANPSEVLSGQWASNLSVIDLSSSHLKGLEFLHGKWKLQVLDLGGTMIENGSMDAIAKAGSNLRRLDLTSCKVDSKGIRILAGHVPKLEEIILSATLVDDSVFTYLQLMPSLKMIDLSYTYIKGIDTEVNSETRISSFMHIRQLQSLTFLNLRQALISDDACQGFTCLHELSHLQLRSEQLSDHALHHLSLLKKLASLSIEGAMLTDSGLLNFKPPLFLKELSLLDCWLLTKKGINQFLQIHGNITLKHELLSDGTGGRKASPVKEIEGFTAPKQKNVKEKSPSRVRMQQNFYKKKPESSLVVVDQRIKYTKADLLFLRGVEHHSQQGVHSIGKAVFDFHLIQYDKRDRRHVDLK